MFATWTRRTGWNDNPYADMGRVKILGFIETTILPEYQFEGSKRCVVAIVADGDGKINKVELEDLKYEWE